MPELSTATAAAAGRRSSPLLGLGVIVLVQLMLVVDGSIVTVALPYIRDTFGFTAVALSWVVTSYALAFAGLLLLSSRLGAMIGPRRAIALGIGLFTAASALGAIAPSGWVMILARVLQGAGAALAAPSTMVLVVANSDPGPARVRALSWFVMAASTGGVIGLLLGGVLTSTLGWRWVMLINVPIGLLIVLVLPRYVREMTPVAGRLDLPGAVTSAVGLTALVYAFTSAASDGWTHAATLGAFAVAAFGLALFGLTQARGAEPMLPPRLISRPALLAPYIGMLLLPAALFGFFFFTTLFFQDVLHYDALRTGLGFLPLSLAILTSGRLAPRLIERTGPRQAALIGTGLIIIGLALLSRLTPETSYLTGILAPSIILGLGPGFVFTALSATLIAQAAPADMPAASGLMQTMQQLGGALGIAVLTTVFSAVTLTSGPAVAITTSLIGASAFAAVVLVLIAALVRPAATERAPALVTETGHL